MEGLAAPVVERRDKMNTSIVDDEKRRKIKEANENPLAIFDKIDDILKNSTAPFSAEKDQLKFFKIDPKDLNEKARKLFTKLSDNRKKAAGDADDKVKSKKILVIKRARDTSNEGTKQLQPQQHQ